MKSSLLNKKEPLASKIIINAMFAFLVFLPFGYTVFLNIKDLNVMFPLAHDFPLLFMAPFVAIITIILLVWLFNAKATGDKSTMIILSAIVFIAFASRVYVAYKLHPVPISDFASCYQFALDGTSFIENMKRVPYNAIYSMLIHSIMSIFGEGTFQIQVFHAVISAIISVTLYFTCISFTNEKRIGLIAAFFYAVNPAAVLYSTVISTENVSALFFALMLLFMAKAWIIREDNLKKSLLFSFIAGVFLGCMNLFKPVGTLAVVAFAVCEILTYTIPAVIIFFKSKGTRKHSAKMIVVSVALLMLIPIANSVVFSMGKVCREAALGSPIDDKDSYSLSSIGSVAYFGLSPIGGGGWHHTTSATLREATAMFNDPKQTSDYLMNKLIVETKAAGLPAFITMIKNKINISWANEWLIGYYATRVDSTNTAATFMDNPVGNTLTCYIPTLYTVLINLGASLGFLYLFLRKKRCPTFCTFGACMLGIVFVSFTILETQSRYKSTFVPIICIFAAIGYTHCVGFAMRILRSIKNKCIAHKAQ
ncbi:MAG: glycosyltransferase family 39 protein [Christensenella sp.]